MKRVANEGFPQFMPARNESSKDENITKGISAAKEAAKGVAAIKFAQPDKKKKNNNQLTTTKDLETNEESN